MIPDADPRAAGREPARPPGPRHTARLAEGWQRRFVVDQTRLVEMVRLYQELGYETAVDPFAPEEPTGEPAEEPATGVGGAAAGDRPDPRCGDCRLVTMHWLHVLYTRPVRTPRAG
jgi:hypothetical protein